MKTTTERAAEIRAEFKRRGWSGRDVSVRSESFSMGSAIRVELRTGGLAKGATYGVIEEIAKGAERIRRCEMTGEILGGGNRYVTVGIDREAEKVLARRHHAQVSAAADALLACGEPNRLFPIAGTEYSIGWASNARPDARYGFSLWNGSMAADYCGDVEQASYRLARLVEGA